MVTYVPWLSLWLPRTLGLSRLRRMSRTPSSTSATPTAARSRCSRSTSRAARWPPCRPSPAIGTVMPLALSPDRRRLYAARRNEPWSVLAFAIDPRDGRLAPLGEAPLPQSMAHIAVDGSGRWLFSASYHGNLIAREPDRRRRPARRGHAGDPHRRRRRTRCARRRQPLRLRHLAGRRRGDAVRASMRRAARSRRWPRATVAVRDGAGPRHLAFHPDGRFVYLLNELDASVDVLASTRTAVR